MKAGSPRFLIVRLGSLGDVIHAIPAAAALRRRYPEARIDWAVEPPYAEVLALVTGIDERIVVNPRGAVGPLLSAIAAMRRARYDAAIDLQGLVKSAVLARASGARRIIGLTRSHLREPFAATLYSMTADPGAAVHVIHKSLAALAPLGVTDTRVMFPLDVPRTAIVDDVAGRFERGDYAVVNPGAAWPNKRWPPARFGALAAAIHARFGIRSLVLWGPGEQGLAETAVREAHGAAELAPPTSMADLFGILQHARLLVSGDTGPLHIGAAMRAPIVALFGPTSAERNGPWDAADISVSRLDRCVCHYERRCRLATPCIDSIAVDEVTAAVERRLA